MFPLYRRTGGFQMTPTNTTTIKIEQAMTDASRAAYAGQCPHAPLGIPKWALDHVLDTFHYSQNNANRRRVVAERRAAERDTKKQDPELHREIWGADG